MGCHRCSRRRRRCRRRAAVVDRQAAKLPYQFERENQGWELPPEFSVGASTLMHVVVSTLNVEIRGRDNLNSTIRAWDRHHVMDAYERARGSL